MHYFTPHSVTPGKKAVGNKSVCVYQPERVCEWIVVCALPYICLILWKL